MLSCATQEGKQSIKVLTVVNMLAAIADMGIIHAPAAAMAPQHIKKRIGNQGVGAPLALLPLWLPLPLAMARIIQIIIIIPRMCIGVRVSSRR